MDRYTLLLVDDEGRSNSDYYEKNCMGRNWFFCDWTCKNGVKALEIVENTHRMWWHNGY